MIAETANDHDQAQVVYVTCDEPGISRRRAGRGFTYSSPDRRRITDQDVLSRIRSLVIPPAWREVWVCASPDGHIQAVGFDQRGRKQYIYHPAFRQMRDDAKFEHMMTFAEALPALRRRVAQDMAVPGLGRDKVLATVVTLLETTMIRVGNAAYARANESFGLTTLRGDHVTVRGASLRFQFRGKSGKIWNLDIRDRRAAKIVRACQHLPGQHLFAYLDDEGVPQSISSADVNAYLKRVSGRDITAKDFRTWAGTVLAARALTTIRLEGGELPAARIVSKAMREVSCRLGNTPAVCRSSYVHPQLIEAFLNDELRLDVGVVGNGRQVDAHALHADESALLAFLRRGSRPPEPGPVASNQDDDGFRDLAAAGS
jgi:DNA topoisomerase-1